MALAKRPLRNKTLAELMDTSEQQVSNWIKTGAIKQSSLVRICEVLNIKLSEFVALSEEDDK